MIRRHGFARFCVGVMTVFGASGCVTVHGPRVEVAERALTAKCTPTGTVATVDPHVLDAVKLRFQRLERCEEDVEVTVAQEHEQRVGAVMQWAGASVAFLVGGIPTTIASVAIASKVNSSSSRIVEPLLYAGLFGAALAGYAAKMALDHEVTQLPPTKSLERRHRQREVRTPLEHVSAESLGLGTLTTKDGALTLSLDDAVAAKLDHLSIDGTVARFDADDAARIEALPACLEARDAPARAERAQTCERVGWAFPLRPATPKP